MLCPPTCGGAMEKQTCRREEAWVEAIHRITSDDKARREWLWIRAHEKEDRWSIRSLERADRGLRARMTQREDYKEAKAIEDPRARREAFGRMLDRMYPEDDDVPCDCPRCG